VAIDWWICRAHAHDMRTIAWSRSDFCTWSCIVPPLMQIFIRVTGFVEVVLPCHKTWSHGQSHNGPVEHRSHTVFYLCLVFLTQFHERVNACSARLIRGCWRSSTFWFAVVAVTVRLPFRLLLNLLVSLIISLIRVRVVLVVGVIDRIHFQTTKV